MLTKQYDRPIRHDPAAQSPGALPCVSLQSLPGSTQTGSQHMTVQALGAFYRILNFVYDFPIRENQYGLVLRVVRLRDERRRIRTRRG